MTWAGWCRAHGELYATEFGWDLGFESLVARIVADYAGHPEPARQAAWIAELDGRRVGCVSCVAEPMAEGESRSRTARLRILLVHPEARGNGLGSRLVHTCLTFARDTGYERVVLWTYQSLTTARKLYLNAGFALAAEHPEHSFGQDLIGQTYALRLAAPAG